MGDFFETESEKAAWGDTVALRGDPLERKCSKVKELAGATLLHLGVTP